MLTSYVSVSGLIDWNNDGDYLDANEDVSADMRYPISTKRGRAQATDDFAVGTGQFKLRNGEGAYTPFYASSPIYPNVLPGRPVKIQATYNATTYPVFVGRCSPDSGRWASDGEIAFSMVDAFEQMRLGLTRTALLESKRTDEIQAQILDDIGWAAGDRALDTGVQTLGVFTNHNRTPLAALQLAARQELGGGSFISRDGKYTFQNRQYRSLQAVYATLAGTFDELVPSLRQEDLVDTVRATYARFVIGTSLVAVYTQTAAGRQVDAGSTSARNTFEGSFNGAGAKNCVTPAATTDYTFNSAADGTGTDKTAQVTVSAFTATSGGFSITFNNADSSPVYLQTFQVRGYPITNGSEENAVTVSVASPIVTGQQLSGTFDYNDDADSVKNWANYQAAARSLLIPRVSVSITPDTDALMATVLGAEIGKRLTLTDTAAPWLTQLSGDFFIESIDLSIEGPGLVKATWGLFSEELSAGNFFRISGAAGAGADYSTIATAGATSGYDRIGF